MSISIALEKVLRETQSLIRYIVSYTWRDFVKTLRWLHMSQ